MTAYPDLALQLDLPPASTTAEQRGHLRQRRDDLLEDLRAGGRFDVRNPPTASLLRLQVTRRAELALVEDALLDLFPASGNEDTR